MDSSVCVRVCVCYGGGGIGFEEVLGGDLCAWGANAEKPQVKTFCMEEEEKGEGKSKKERREKGEVRRKWEEMRGGNRRGKEGRKRGVKMKTGGGKRGRQETRRK